MKGGWGAGLFQSRFMDQRPVPRIVKLRLFSKYNNAHVQRTAEILSRIYVKFKLFEMPSLKWELLWLKIPRRSSSEPFVSPIHSNIFDWNLMSPNSAPLLSATSRYARVDQYHLSWRNPGWENAKYVERTGARQERKTQSGPRETERSSALLVPKTPPISRSNHSGQGALDRWANLLETLGVFSALSGEHGSTDGPQLVPAGLPLTTGKLSGVWERTLAVSAELAAPTC